MKNENFHHKTSILKIRSYLVFWIVLTVLHFVTARIEGYQFITLENDESFNVPKQTTRQTTLLNSKIYCLKTFQHFQNLSCAKVQVSLFILSLAVFAKRMSECNERVFWRKKLTSA